MFSFINTDEEKKAANRNRFAPRKTTKHGIYTRRARDRKNIILELKLNISMEIYFSLYIYCVRFSAANSSCNIYGIALFMVLLHTYNLFNNMKKYCTNEMKWKRAYECCFACESRGCTVAFICISIWVQLIKLKRIQWNSLAPSVFCTICEPISPTPDTINNEQ